MPNDHDNPTRSTAMSSSDASQINNTLQGMATQLGNLDGRLGSIENAVSSLRDELRGDIKDLHARIDPISNRYERLNGNRATQEQRFEALERKVDEASKEHQEQKKTMSSRGWMLLVLILSAVLSGCSATGAGLVVYYVTGCEQISNQTATNPGPDPTPVDRPSRP